MRLFRFGDAGSEEPGIELPGGERLSVSHLFEDYDEGFFASGGIEALQSWVADGCLEAQSVPVAARLGAPVARPSKIVCVGRNYAEHAKEFGEAVPDEPILFLKATTALCGPEDPVKMPKGAEKLDYEVELAVVIGKTATEVTPELAGLHVAGYSLFCDYTERAWQKERSGQWTKGKSYDSFGPLGPYLVTPDEIQNPKGLRLWLDVNGHQRQCGYTRDMIMDVPHLISYISQFMTLLPGDIVATGTPSGVGMGMTPPEYLKLGDRVHMGCEGLGSMGQRVVAS